MGVSVMMEGVVGRQTARMREPKAEEEREAALPRAVPAAHIPHRTGRRLPKVNYSWDISRRPFSILSTCRAGNHCHAPAPHCVQNRLPGLRGAPHRVQNLVLSGMGAGA
jgi:hypothetical protein